MNLSLLPEYYVMLRLQSGGSGNDYWQETSSGGSSGHSADNRSGTGHRPGTAAGGVAYSLAHRGSHRLIPADLSADVPGCPVHDAGLSMTEQLAKAYQANIHLFTVIPTYATVAGETAATSSLLMRNDVVIVVREWPE